MIGKLVPGLALLLVPVAAAGVWLPTMKLGSDYVSQPQVALTPRGDTFVVWRSGQVINARFRLARAREWSASRRLSPSGRAAVVPRVAVDASGNALAAWYLSGSYPPPDASGASREEAVQAAFRPAGRSWERAQTLARGADPDVALDPKGNALVVWLTRGGVVRGSFRRAHGRWESVRNLSTPGWQASSPRVAFDRRGNAVAAWYRQPERGLEIVVEAAVRPAGRPWQAARELGGGVDYEGNVEVAFDAAGTALVAWIGAGNGSGPVEAAERPAGGDWSPPEQLSSSGTKAKSVSLGVGVSGHTVVAWSHFVPPFLRVEAAVRSGRRAWGPPRDLSGDYFASSPQVAVDPAGNALVVWYHSEDIGRSIIDVATRPRGGTWSTPRALANKSLEPDVAVDTSGNTVAVWQQLTTKSSALEARAFDASGPIFARVRIPRRGSVGIPLALSVSAFDVWSRLRGAPVWSFGDGSGAKGGSVTHSYSRKGNFRVMVRATDSRGNSSALARTVSVG